MHMWSASRAFWGSVPLLPASMAIFRKVMGPPDASFTAPDCELVFSVIGRCVGASNRAIAGLLLQPQPLLHFQFHKVYDFLLQPYCPVWAFLR